MLPFLRVVSRFFLFCLVLLVLPLSVRAQAVPSLGQITLQLKWLHQFQFAGYYAALEKGYFAEEGVGVVLRERDPATNNILQVLEGEAEYGVADASLLLYQERGLGVRIIAPIFQHSPNVLLTLASANIRSPSDLAGKRVRLYSNDAEGFAILAMLAESGVLDSGIVRQPFTQDFSVLARGESDAIYAYSTNEPYVLRQQGVETHVINPVNFGIDMYGDMLFTTEKEVREHPERVAAMRRAVLRGWAYALDHKEEMARLILERYSQKKTFDALMYEAHGLDELTSRRTIALGTLDRGRLDYMARLFMRHGLSEREISVAGQIYDPVPKGRFSLSEEERAFLAEHPVIRLAIDNNWEPFEFIDEKGQYRGIAAEYMDLVASRLGVSFDVARKHPWNDAVEMLRRRELDVFSCAARTPERQLFAHFTRPYVRSPMVVVTRSDHEFIPELSRLEGRRVAVPRGYASHEYMRNEHPRIGLLLVENVDEGLRAVALGQVEAFIDNLAVISYRLKKEGLANLKIAGQAPITFDLSMGVRSDWPLMQGILQKALDSIPEEEKTAIFNRWLQIEFEQPVDYGELLPYIAAIVLVFSIVLLYSLRLRGLNRRISLINTRLTEQEQSLRDKNAELEFLSTTDRLTGVFNRRWLDDALTRNLSKAQRYGRPLSLLLFDLDHFKDVNDRYGHLVGDEVLKVCADLVAARIRTSDFFGRWGGEEFIVLCPETTLQQAGVLAESLRRAVEGAAFPEGIRQTISIGVAELGSSMSADDLIRQADRGLYQAKAAGRNRVASVAAGE
ncbi:MAG: diguanylate cyclase [Halothiobacillaceae bacterium]|nr:diguanylate cyclase [Halothiobacillaceae bacterium]